MGRQTIGSGLDANARDPLGCCAGFHCEHFHPPGRRPDIAGAAGQPVASALGRPPRALNPRLTSFAVAERRRAGGLGQVRQGRSLTHPQRRERGAACDVEFAQRQALSASDLLHSCAPGVMRETQSSRWEYGYLSTTDGRPGQHRLPSSIPKSTYACCAWTVGGDRKWCAFGKAKDRGIHLCGCPGHRTNG